MKRSIAITICLVVAIKLFSQTVGSYDTTMVYNGQSRVLSFFVPTDYTSSYAYPLVIGLHSGGQYSWDLRDMLVGFADSVNAIIVCPDDPSFSTGLIQPAENFAKALYNIDTGRIILGGYSLGGKNALSYGLSHFNNYAGILAIAPAIESVLQMQGSYYSYANSTGVNTCIIVGTIDVPIYGFTGIFFDSISNRNGLIDTIIKQGVDHFGSYYSSVDFNIDCESCWNFILQQTPTEIEKTETWSNKITIFPNPITDFAKIKIQDRKRATVLILSTIDGKVIKRVKNINSEEIILNCTNIPGGIYYVKVFSDTNEIIGISKLVVR